MQFQREVLPIDHIVVTFKDGSTRYVEKAILGIATTSEIDLSFVNLSQKEIIDFLVGMADIGEEIQFQRKDVEVRDIPS